MRKYCSKVLLKKSAWLLTGMTLDELIHKGSPKPPPVLGASGKGKLYSKESVHTTHRIYKLNTLESKNEMMLSFRPKAMMF